MISPGLWSLNLSMHWQLPNLCLKPQTLPLNSSRSTCLLHVSLRCLIGVTNSIRPSASSWFCPPPILPAVCSPSHCWQLHPVLRSQAIQSSLNSFSHPILNPSITLTRFTLRLYLEFSHASAPLFLPPSSLAWISSVAPSSSFPSHSHPHFCLCSPLSIVLAQGGLFKVPTRSRSSCVCNPNRASYPTHSASWCPYWRL